MYVVNIVLRLKAASYEQSMDMCGSVNSKVQQVVTVIVSDVSSGMSMIWKCTGATVIYTS